MGFLDQFTPAQQKAVMIGAPVVGVFALISHFRKPAAAPAAPTGTVGDPAALVGGTGSIGSVMPSTDAIGTGQLADFESSLTGLLNGLSVQVQDQTNLLTTPPPAPPPPPTTPAPAPTPAAETAPAPTPPPVNPTHVCAPPPGWPGAPGEVIIKRLDAPGGGCWYISNLGGVANVGGAPFKGAAIGNRMGPGFENPPRYIVDATVSGNGYVLFSNRGEKYDYS